MNVFSAPWHELRGFSRLYLDYIAGKDSVLQFFPGKPGSDQVYKTIAANRDAGNTDTRQLARILTGQNTKYNAPEPVFNAISRLAEGKALCVVTGQQAGFLGGPLYTLYKALTAVYRSRYLEKLLQLPVIPVFWMETGDNDLREIARTGYYDIKNNFIRRRFEYSPELADDSVGLLRFPESIRSWIEGIFTDLPKTDFSGQLKSDILEYYREGNSPADAFASLYSQLTGSLGLVFFDPFDPRARELAHPLFKRITDRKEAVNASLQETEHLLRSREYHIQAKTDTESYNLFISKNGRRLHLKTEDLDAVSGSVITPNVLMRPVMQDYLFPTVEYVAGPGEIAYLAQLKKAYSVLDVPMPVIYPRKSFTILNRKAGKLIDKYKLGSAAFGSNADISRHIVRQISAYSDITQFQELEDEIKAKLAEASDRLSEIDRSVKDGFANLSQKMSYEITKLRDRFMKNVSASDEEVAADASALREYLMPADNFQEREAGPVSFLVRFGSRFTESVFSCIDDNYKHHDVISM